MTRLATWETIGTNVRDCLDIDSVLKESNLDYTVETENMQTASGIVIPDKYATVANYNDGSKEYKGIVGNGYSICQNIDAFNFIDTLKPNGLEYVKAGETAAGMVYIISKLPSFEVFGDEIVPYVIFQNSHNGRFALQATICALRIVCNNQFASTFGSFNNNIKIYHTNSLQSKLATSSAVLQSVGMYMQDFKKDAEMLYNKKLSVEEVNKIFDTYFEIAKQNDMSSRQANRLIANRQKIEIAYNADDNQNFKGTVWGVVNAFTDFNTHREVKNTPTAADSKFITTTFDNRELEKFMKIATSMSAA